MRTFRGYMLAAIGLMAVSLAHGSTVHVWSGGSNEEPYETWAKAATSLQTAVSYAIDNSIGTVQLTNETFSITSQINITGPVTVRGVTRDSTIILGPGDPTGTRAFNINHANARAESLTVTNFYINANGSGIYLTAGTLNDVLVTRCRTWKDRNGVGIYVGANGVVTNSVIANNYGRDQNNRGAVYIAAGGLVTHSVIRGNSQLACAGVYVNGGTLCRSDVINNTGNQYGDGTAVQLTGGGLVEFCMITNNVFSHDSGDKGGGVLLQTSGTIRNCLIADNRSRGYGGGVYMTGGLVESCTIVGNHAANGANTVGDGGGIYATAGTIRNTIIDENTSALLNPNLRLGSATITYSCIDVDPLPEGDGNKAGPAGFIDSGAGNYGLTSGSPACDSGTNIVAWMTGVTDLTGVTDRIINDTVDMGAYEREATAGLEVSFIRSPASGLAPLSVTFQASVDGAIDPENLVYYWDFQNDGTWDESGLLLTNVTHVFGPGQYDVRMTVSNATENATILNAANVTVLPETMYVASGGGHVYPYVSWTDAAHTIGDAVSAAIAGVTILVTNETFLIASPIVVDKGVTIRGLDRDTTVIDAQQSGRLFSLNHPQAILDSLTIKEGRSWDGVTGVALNMPVGTITNCVVTHSSGGGSQNSNHGAVYVGSQGLVTHSVIRNTSGSINGAVFVDGGTLRRSYVINNSNRSSEGGGVKLTSGTVEFCVITNNVSAMLTTDQDGGGVRMSGGTLRNCLITTNRVSRHGGGVFMSGGLVESCTIARNRANNGSGVGDGGGIYATGGEILNTIIDENTAAVDNPNLRLGSATITYSCIGIDPLPAGAGNRAAPAGFVDSANGDYSLVLSSPAVNSGQDQGWMDGALDLIGNPRLVGAVDMGAYEHQGTPGSIFLLR